MREGQVIAKGKYRLRSLLGRGGMGEVYLADGPAGRAAVKFIQPDLVDGQLEARFKREAKIASLLRSPHIASVLDAGRTRSGELFIAFEYLEGEPLSLRIARDQIVAMSALASIIDQTLQGLADAHRANVVHRDVKPANIFLVSGASAVKLLDFGVAKRSASSATSSTSSRALTAVGATVGSTMYMAPEQIGGAALVDARADLYAVGVVIFQCLAGRLPFVSDGSIVMAKTQFDALSLRDVTGVAWPDETEAFLRRLLQRVPKRRIQSAEEARECWRRCATLSHPEVRPSETFREGDTEANTEAAP